MSAGVPRFEGMGALFPCATSADASASLGGQGCGKPDVDASGEHFVFKFQVAEHFRALVAVIPQERVLTSQHSADALSCKRDGFATLVV